MATFLVEIRAKDWVPAKNEVDRILTFKKVQAGSELASRFAAIDQFLEQDVKDPEMIRKMNGLGITAAECCAPCAVQID
jgi:hypothetical protein